MISKELYKCAIKYYTIHKELNTETKISNINLIFGISKTSFYRFFKNNNEINNKNKKKQ